MTLLAYVTALANPGLFYWGGGGEGVECELTFKHKKKGPDFDADKKKKCPLPPPPPPPPPFPRNPFVGYFIQLSLLWICEFFMENSVRSIK